MDHRTKWHLVFNREKKFVENLEKLLKKVKENAEHFILHCMLYEVERLFQDGSRPLGTEGEGVIEITRKAIFKFLNDTVLMSRIWEHSCTIGGGIHLKVVCNPPLIKRRSFLWVVEYNGCLFVCHSVLCS